MYILLSCIEDGGQNVIGFRSCRSKEIMVDEKDREELGGGGVHEGWF